MLRKIVFVLLALSLPLLAASAASAQQYPPSGDGPAAASVARSDAGPTDTGSAPLARTGTDLTLPLAAGGVLLAGGAVALVVSRRRPTSLA